MFASHHRWHERLGSRHLTDGWLWIPLLVIFVGRAHACPRSLQIERQHLGGWLESAQVSSCQLAGTLKGTEPFYIYRNNDSDYNDFIAITQGQSMSSLTVRNLDESVKNSLRLRAARHGWSMEQEVRQILQRVVAPEQAAQVSFAERINSRFCGLQAESLPLPERQIVRTPPDLNTL